MIEEMTASELLGKLDKLIKRKISDYSDDALARSSTAREREQAVGAVTALKDLYEDLCDSDDWLK